MRAIATSVAAAAAFTFGVGGEAFAAQEASQQAACAPVYDRTGEAADPNLQLAIGQFTMHGVEVHVQILDATATAQNGINSKDDIPQYQKRLADQCNFGPNFIDITTTQEPNSSAVLKGGTAATEIPYSTIYNANNDLDSTLADQDGNYQYQGPIATLLHEIDPFTPQDATSSTGGSQTATKEKPSPIPWGPIGEASGIGAGAVLVVARTRRGYTIHKALSTSGAAASAIHADLEMGSLRMKELLELAPADDGVGLRATDEKIVAIYEPLEAADSALAAAYRSEVFRPWPSLRAVRTAATPLDKQVGTARGLHQEITAEIETFERQSKTIDSRVIAFNRTLASVNDAAGKLSEGGWDLSAWQERFPVFEQLQVQLARLRQSYYVEKPSLLLDSHEPDLRTLLTDLQQLSVRRSAADVRITRQADDAEVSQAAAREAIVTLERLRDKYHESCYGDIGTNDSQLAEHVQVLVEQPAQGEALRGVMSVMAVEQAETVLQGFDNLRGTIAGLSSQVMDRQQRLVRIERELPGRMTRIDTTLGEVHTFAFTDYATDVEEDTRQLIGRLQSAVSTLHSDAAETRPQYLRIEEQAGQYEDQIEQAMRQARAQRQEMVTLRSDIGSLHSSAVSDLAALQSYLAYHAADTYGIGAGVVIPSVSTNLPRQGLRDQRTQLKSTCDAIRRAQSNAQNMVQAANARRAAEAAAVAAAIAAQQAQQAAANASNNSATGNY